MNNKILKELMETYKKDVDLLEKSYIKLIYDDYFYYLADKENVVKEDIALINKKISNSYYKKDNFKEDYVFIKENVKMFSLEDVVNINYLYLLDSVGELFLFREYEENGVNYYKIVYKCKECFSNLKYFILFFSSKEGFYLEDFEKGNLIIDFYSIEVGDDFWQEDEEILTDRLITEEKINFIKKIKECFEINDFRNISIDYDEEFDLPRIFIDCLCRNESIYHKLYKDLEKVLWYVRTLDSIDDSNVSLYEFDFPFFSSIDFQEYKDKVTNPLILLLNQGSNYDEIFFKE